MNSLGIKEGPIDPLQVAAVLGLDDEVMYVERDVFQKAIDAEFAAVTVMSSEDGEESATLAVEDSSGNVNSFVLDIKAQTLRAII